MRLLIVVFYVVMMYGCANIIPPTGGPRDLQAPVLVRATPEQGTTRFNSRIIKLEFDEYIKLQNQGNVRITPALPVKPVFTDRYNTLIIDLEEMVLEPNTTYTFNFGDALTDLNENNKFQNLRYVFSTGDFLDSLNVNGVLLDAEKRMPVEKVIVALYPVEEQDNIDSLVYLKKPFYFLKTDKTGVFSLENLRGGNYVLFAFDDKDNNLLYKNIEPLAFLDSMVVVDTTTRSKQFEMIVFESKRSLLKIVERRSTEPGLVRLRFSSSIDSLQVQLLQPDNKSVQWQLMGDSAYVFHQALDADSLRLALWYDGKHDTLTVNNRKKGDAPLKTAGISLKAGNQPSVLEPLVLKVGRPIAKLDTSLIRWKEDTLFLNDFVVDWQIQGNQLIAKAALKENTRYELFFEKGALIDWLDIPADTFRFTFNSLSKESFGDLLFDGLDSIPSHFTHLQLLDEQYQVLRTLPIKRGEKLAMRQLRPVSYKLRLLADTNGNGKWDSGDFGSRVQPELLWYYPDLVKLRANWEIEVSLSLAGRK